MAIALQSPRVLVADDHPLVRDGLRSLIAGEMGWSVCAETANGREAVELASELKPELAIIDMTMPELNGLEATRQIRKLCPETEILIFTGHETEELIHQVFEAGARSYILKSDAREQLVNALNSVAAHKPYFTSHIGEVIFARFMHKGKVSEEEHTHLGRLTDRERHIVQLLSEGLSNKEVGSKLGISVKTVETHRAAIMRKLNLGSFSALVRYAIRNHIIEP